MKKLRKLLHNLCSKGVFKDETKSNATALNQPANSRPLTSNPPQNLQETSSQQQHRKSNYINLSDCLSGNSNQPVRYNNRPKKRLDSVESESGFYDEEGEQVSDQKRPKSDQKATKSD